MPSITHGVSDLTVRLPNGVLATIIDGQVDVDYDMQDAEPEVGISDAYVAEFSLEGGEIEVVFSETDKSAVALRLWAGHPVLAEIAEAYKDAIEEACMEDAAEDYWTDRLCGR